MKIQWKKLIVQLAIPFLVGFVSYLLTPRTQEVYNSLKLPSFAPPAMVFPIVWSILYLLLGISAYLLAITPTPLAHKRYLFSLYGAQLLLNVLWSVSFFRLQQQRMSLWILLVLVALAMVSTVRLYTLRPLAGLLFLPYTLWISFALLLSAAIERLSLT